MESVFHGGVLMSGDRAVLVEGPEDGQSIHIGACLQAPATIDVETDLGTTVRYARRCGFRHRGLNRLSENMTYWFVGYVAHGERE